MKKIVKLSSGFIYIGKLRASFMLLMLAINLVGLNAATDVTNKYLTNADFSKGPVTTVDITTLTMHVVDNVVLGLQDADGWTTCIINENPNYPKDGMAGAIMSYGSTNKIGSGICAPSTSPNNNSGNCLGFVAVWSGGGYYYQDVTLPAGKYTITIPVYNAQSTRAYESYIGFIPDNGTPKVISGTPTVGRWTILTTSFVLTKETHGRIALGYVSTGEGTAAAPHLFFDSVSLEYEELVDCTSFIQNPGFDEDISFDIYGEPNKAVTLEYEHEFIHAGGELRSFMVYKAADGSIYNREKYDQQGYNAAGKTNWDGYKTYIRGWETTNKSDTAAWIYYGSIPYALGDGMMIFGENDEKKMIEKPAEIDTDENIGVLYLRAGWQNQCTYKQTVRGLPQAKYYLTYYIRNTNVDKSRLYAEATNLCNVTCNGVSFVDNEGFNSNGWIKHSIEFIPVDSFSVEFGCRASNDYSYNNPILWVDGIELHRIGIATEEEIDAAYLPLVEKADSLVGIIHFTADRLALQGAIIAFENSKDYVALNQAVLAAEASENKYLEIMDEDGILQNVSQALETDAYGGAKVIVQFAYEKTIEWLSSDNASYIGADNYLAKLNAYANIYATVFMEAEQYIVSAEEAQAAHIRSLMESQKTSLIASMLLDVTEVEEYAQTLRNAMHLQEQTLSLTTLPEMTYGDAAYSLPAKTNEGLSLIWQCSDTTVATISDSILTIKNAGTTIVTASQVGNESYKSFSRTFTFTVNKAPLTVTANDCTKKQGEDNPILTVSYSGFKNGDTASSLITQPTITTTSTKDSGAGTYPITVCDAASNNYTFTYVSGTLTVTTNIITGEYNMYSDGITVHVYDSETLDIKLDNEAPIIMFEFYMQLPTGLYITQNEYDEYDVVLNKSRIDNTHVLVVEKGDEDMYHFLCYSSKNKPFIGNSDNLLSVNIACQQDVQAGTYHGTVKNIILSDQNKHEISVPNFSFNIEVVDYIPGDLNNDKKINGMDIVEMVSLIMDGGFSRIGDLYPSKPDGRLNGMDLVELVELVMSQTISAKNISFAKGIAHVENNKESNLYNDNLMVTDFTIKPGTTTDVSVDLNNPQYQYIMTEFWMELPEGISIATDGDGEFLYEMGTRFDNSHSLVISKETAGNIYHFLIYSSKNHLLRDNFGSLFTLTLQATDDVALGDYTGRIFGQIFADSNKDEHNPADVTFKITIDNVTDVDRIITDGDNVNVFSIDGRMLRRSLPAFHGQQLLQRGLYIIGGKKVVIR